MKKGVLIAVLVVAALAVVLLRGKKTVPAAREPAPPPVQVVDAPVAEPETQTQAQPALESPAPAVALEKVPTWSSGEVATLAPEQGLESARLVMRNFALRFKGNPVGNNAEITAALNGDNPARARFLDADVHHVNEQGEWVDGWGRPYFFHQLSADEMEIRSAGPDRILWTPDDLVLR